jgi:uncharacterized RmlC-like cupin family protein
VHDDIRVLTDDELEDAAGTPGIRRRSAFVDEGHWFGHVEAEPATMSGWHHHGDMVTLAYVLTGRIRFEFGPGGARRVEAAAGDYVLVPARTIHREGNTTDTPGELVLVRIGEGEPVFAVGGPARA